MGNHKRLVEIQRDVLDSDLEKPERAAVHQSWFNEDSVDAWLHNRMYQTIKPVAEHYKKGSWLSIGDGRYGLDSVRLAGLFDLKVLPTDISGNCLAEGKKKGLIEDYSVENAESLSFADDSFDVVFCKESYHHFPRPIIALYEMLRVAREAVILIEPYDNLDVVISKKAYLTAFIKRIVSKITGKKQEVYKPELRYRKHAHEGGGNFVYSLSNREVDKIVHGLDLGGSAYYHFNSSYLKGVEFEPAEENNELFRKIKSNIAILDALGGAQLTSTVIFPGKISSDLKLSMEQFGYTFFEKTDNPVLKKGS